MDINDRVLTGVFCFLTLPQIVDIQILNKKAYIVQLVFVYSFLLLEKSNADEFCVFFLGIVISLYTRTNFTQKLNDSKWVRERSNIMKVLAQWSHSFKKNKKLK